MPVVKLSVDRINDLLGADLQLEELTELLFNLKSEIEEIDDKYITIEINSDRPDMMMSEGVVRALKGLLELELGAPKYIYENMDASLEIYNVPSRRYIAMGFVLNIKRHEDLVDELIQFQEKIHTTYGRNRKKIAIGIHDADKIDSYSCRYMLVDLNTEFIPLDIGRPMSIKEVLKSTPQGVKYGDLSLYDGKHPAIICEDEIISLPPVINSDITRIDYSTKNILIDVTGIDRELVNGIVELLTTTIAEGSHTRNIGRVLHIDKTSNTEFYLPTYSMGEMSLDTDLVRKTIGYDIEIGSIVDSLRKMRFDAYATDERSIRVYVPPFRLDIMEPIDLVEDIAIAIGYGNLEPEIVPSFMPGRYTNMTVTGRKIRDLMIGLGYSEIYTHILMPDYIVEKLSPYKYLKVLNPVSSEMSVARPSLILSLLNFLRRVQYDPKPIKIFEIGEAIVRGDDGYWKTVYRLSAALMDHEVGFEDIQADLYALIRALNLAPSVEPYSNPLFIEGRCGRIKVGEVYLGVIGEANLDILEKLDIVYPIAMFEIDLDKLVNLMIK